MKKIKCIRKNVKDFEQIIEGYIYNKIYDFKHNVIGYEVKYRDDRGCIICLEKDFDILEV